jgi:hypothetical protein
MLSTDHFFKILVAQMSLDRSNPRVRIAYRRFGQTQPSEDLRQT